MSSDNINEDDEKKLATTTKAPVANDRDEEEIQKSDVVEEDEKSSVSLTTGGGISTNGMERAVGLKGANMEMEMIEDYPQPRRGYCEFTSENETTGEEEEEILNKDAEDFEEEPPEEDEFDNISDQHQTNEEENQEDTPLNNRRRTRPGAERVYPSGHEGGSSEEMNSSIHSQRNDVENPQIEAIPVSNEIYDATPLQLQSRNKQGMMIRSFVVILIIAIILLSVLLSKPIKQPSFPPETSAPTLAENFPPSQEPSKPTKEPSFPPETSAPTSAEYFRRSKAFDALKNEYPSNAVPVLPETVNDLIGARDKTNSTSQERAAEWLLFIDPLALNHAEYWFFPRYGLAVLYFATTSPESSITWTNSLWLFGKNVCNWVGITCNNDTDTIEKLDLEQQNLGGPLPMEIKYLTTLKEFVVQKNKLVGTPPWNSFFHLHNLTTLHLRDNSFTGTLPKRIGTMSSLTFLYLSMNRFTGTIPKEIFRANKLESLELHSNDLNGTYPYSSCLYILDFTIDCNDIFCSCCDFYKNCYFELVRMETLWGDSRGDEFGKTVSLSDKGDMLAVVSPVYDEGGLYSVGLIQVFHRQEANHWWKEIFNITGKEGGDKIGLESFSFSGDGKRMMFGSCLSSNQRGYAKIVEIDGGKTIKLVGDKEYDFFGRRVSISNKGDRVAVAAWKYIRVYDVMNDLSLKQLGDDISTFWNPSVALSADGDVLGIGEPEYDNNKGRIRILKWDGLKWIKIGEEFLGDNDDDEFGWSLDLSANGQRVLIGTKGNYVKVYHYNQNNWKMIGQKLEGGSDDDGRFGYSVSLSNDGKRIILGSPFFTSGGLSYRGRGLLYQYHAGSWKQIGDDILGEHNGDRAGWSVSISGDGNYFALGIPIADSEYHYKWNVGSVIAYKIV